MTRSHNSLRRRIDAIQSQIIVRKYDYDSRQIKGFESSRRWGEKFASDGEEMLCRHQRLKKCMNQEQNEVNEGKTTRINIR